MIDFGEKDTITAYVVWVFWGLVLIVTLSIAQPLAPFTNIAYGVCMVITALALVAQDKTPAKDCGLGWALGSFMLIAFGPWSLVTVLSLRLYGGYYRNWKWPKWSKKNAVS